MRTTRRRNPFPPFPPTPEGMEQRVWLAALEYFRPYVEYLLNSLREDLLTQAKVPADLVPSRAALNVDSGPIDMLAIALADTRVPSGEMWEKTTPEKYAFSAMGDLFGKAVVNKRAATLVEATTRALANRIRSELEASGRTGLPPSRPSKTPYFTAPKDAPKPPKPPKEPKPKPPPQKPVSERPRPSRPPSAREVADIEDIPDTEDFREEMEEQIAQAAEVIEDEMAAASAPPPTDEDAPAPSRPRVPKRRPLSPSRDQIPRIRRLSEATLRAEREYFYSDRDGSLSERPCPMNRRMAGFWGYRAGMRPTDYVVPKGLFKDYLNDIVLVVIPPGNLVQVFTKGVLTEVFASSREENALNVAARYANQWRGVLPDGTIANDSKRSRLRTAIFAAYYTRTGVSEPVQIGEPIVEVLERDPGARGRKLANPAPMRLFRPNPVRNPRKR